MYRTEGKQEKRKENLHVRVFLKIWRRRARSAQNGQYFVSSVLFLV